MFTSDTDTESIAHLVDACWSEPDLYKAVQIACRRLVGAYAIAVIDHRQPGKVIVAREARRCSLASGDNGKLRRLRCLRPAASHPQHGLSRKRRHCRVDCDRHPHRPPRRHPGRAPGQCLSAFRCRCRTGELPALHAEGKFEQPEALANTLEIVGGSKSIQPGIFGAEAASLLADVDAILILACGTSSHSGYTARYWLEAIAGVPCNVEIASEYRYRTSVPNPRQLIVAISQSGETADTLAALRHATSLGQTRTLAVCNVPDRLSSANAIAALHHPRRPGNRVASTKASPPSSSRAVPLTLVMAKVRTNAAGRNRLHRAATPPAGRGQQGLQLENDINAWAQRADKHHALFPAWSALPIAMEGAL